MAEYTQLYNEGPEAIGPAPLGLTPVGFDNPGIVPVGTGVLTSRYSTSARSLGARPTIPSHNAQYQQRVDESVYVARPQMVPGLRGKAKARINYGDELTEPPIGPIYETNGGYPWTYLPTRVKTFRRTEPILNVYVNGRYVKDYKFRTRQIAEISTSRCQ